MNCYYIHHDEEYFYYHDEYMIFHNTEIAIGFSYFKEPLVDIYHAVLIRHGEHSVVSEWYNRTKRTYIELGDNNLANELHLVVSDKWDIDDLNKIINNSGYLTKFLENNKLV